MGRARSSSDRLKRMSSLYPPPREYRCRRDVVCLSCVFAAAEKENEDLRRRYEEEEEEESRRSR